MITIEQESLRAEAEVAGHCDHKQDHNWLGSSDGALACSDEMKLISCFNFHECDSK